MREWMLFSTKWRHARLTLGRTRKQFGFGVIRERSSTGTSYMEPGSSEHSVLCIQLGPFGLELRHAWKDFSKNRADDPESPYYAQIKSRDIPYFRKRLRDLGMPKVHFDLHGFKPDRSDPHPEETCRICGRDPRNTVHT